jgi:hypothetical protein
MALEKLVQLCRYRMRLASCEGAPGWCEAYGADVALLLMALAAQHTVLRLLLAKVEGKDRVALHAAIRVARDWMTEAGDLLAPDT